MATLFLQSMVNATNYGSVGSGAVTNSFLRLVSFGAFESNHAHFDIQEIKVGTSGYGSSDLFAPVLADLSEFDGVYGDDGSVVAAAGILSVDDASANDHYGWKNLGADITSDLYVQFQLRVRSGNGDPDYHDVWDDATEASTDGTNVDGLFNQFSFWRWNGPGNNFGHGPSGDPTWDTINLHYSFTEPPPPCDCTYEGNATQASAIVLDGPCSEGTICNSGGETTPADEDPLNTVYDLGGTFSRQVWYRLDNPAGGPRYARFVLTNPSGSDIDYAAAVYLEDPAATQTFRQGGGDFNEDWATLAAGHSVTLGTGVDSGGSVWLEVAGDDSDGQGWDCEFDLTWGILEATFYDTPDAGFSGLTEFVSGSVSAFDADDNERLPTSFCRVPDLGLDFAVYNSLSDGVVVWVWTEGGGAPTPYAITPDGVQITSVLPFSFGGGGYGPCVPLLRSDGAHVWLVHYADGPVANPCGAGTISVGKVAVWAWNGAGFTLLGTQNSEGYGDIGDGDPSAGRLTAAACPAEPDVLHVMWSEVGPQSCTIDPNGFSAVQLQRIAYSRWSPTAIVVDADVVTDHGHVDISGNYVGTPLVTQYLFVTNAFGSPVAFYGAPNFNNILFPGIPGAGISYGSVVDMWSINESTGSATLLQTADGAVLVGGGTVLSEDVDTTIWGTERQPQRHYGGVDTIFFSAFWQPTTTPLVLAVPADGSASVAIATSGAGNIEGIAVDPYDDSDNLWWGGEANIFQQSFECSAMPEGGGYGGIVGHFIWAQFGMEMFYAASTDSFYVLGHDTSPTPTNFAPLKIPILRDYFPCTIGSCIQSGLHIWQIF